MTVSGRSWINKNKEAITNFDGEKDHWPYGFYLIEILILFIFWLSTHLASSFFIVLYYFDFCISFFLV